MTSLIKPARETYLSTHERHKSWNRTPSSAPRKFQSKNYQFDSNLVGLNKWKAFAKIQVAKVFKLGAFHFYINVIIRSSFERKL